MLLNDYKQLQDGTLTISSFSSGTQHFFVSSPLLFRNSRPAHCKAALEEIGLGAPPKKDHREAPGVPGSWMWFLGCDRGCEWGLCCVYSMWFDPGYECIRECKHRCRFSRGRFAHCGPSLFEASVFTKLFKEFARRNPFRVKPRGSSITPVLFSKRRRPPQRLPAEESNFSPQAPQEVIVPRTLPSFHVVRPPNPKPKRTRNPRSVSAFSRIRKCLGSHSFGRLDKKRTQKISKLPTCLVAAL